MTDSKLEIEASGSGCVDRATAALGDIDAEDVEYLSLTVEFSENGDSEDTGRYAPTGSKRQALEMLGKGSTPDAMTTEKIHDRMGDVPKGTVSSALTKLKEHGMVSVVDKEGQAYVYQITHKGKKALREAE